MIHNLWKNQFGTWIKQRYQWQWYKWIEKNHSKRSRSKFNSSELVGDSQRKSLRFNQLWSSRWRTWDFGIRWERYNESVQNGRKIFEYDFDPIFSTLTQKSIKTNPIPTQMILKIYKVMATQSWMKWNRISLVFWRSLWATQARIYEKPLSEFENLFSIYCFILFIVQFTCNDTSTSTIFHLLCHFSSGHMIVFNISGIIGFWSSIWTGLQGINPCFILNSRYLSG